MFKRKICPECGEKHIKRSLHFDRFFGIVVGLKVLYKCKNNHIWQEFK